MIRHVHLERGSEINPCAQRFSLCKREVLHIWGAFPAFTRTAIVVVIGRDLAIFLPVLSEIHQKMDQMLVNYE